MQAKQFLFCFPGSWSVHPQFPRLLRAVEILVWKHRLEGHVLLVDMPSVPELTRARGIFSDNRQALAASPLAARQIPVHPDKRRGYRFEPASLRAFLQNLHPDYVYIHGEFWDEPTLQFLRYYRFTRQPRIVAYAAACHLTKQISFFSKTWPFISRSRLWHLLLWGRLTGVSACSTPSLHCARLQGLPNQVPVQVGYLPVLELGEISGPGVRLPWASPDVFILGFAGHLCEQKGWRGLFQALEQLPPPYKLVVAGDGPDREEIQALIQTPTFRDRVFYAGLLPQNTLLATLPLFNVLVLPSITLPHLVEQFGAVLAEAMAWGTPVIGSDSGAIPETIGEAGLIFPEGDFRALAQAIQRICRNRELSQDLARKGFERYRRHFSCEAYADSLAALFGLATH
jgi:glycosyltransferase involved in cell wall biosynthesis